jgi:hypothetical protein
MAKADAPDKILAPFSSKGALVQVLEPSVRDGHGRIVKEGKFDLMEREFRPYKLHGRTDPSSADVEGSEQEFFELGKQVRDERLVGMANGKVVRAVGDLKHGTGMLVDLYGRPIGSNVQEAPVTRSKRSPKDW